MNIMERDQGEAKLHYLDGEYEVVAREVMSFAP